MSTADDGIEPDQTAQLQASWGEVEPTLERLSQGPARAGFYRRLHGEYRVAALYSETSCTAGMQRYATELQIQGLRTMSFDGVTGAAQYVVGAYIESLLLGSSDTREVYDRAAVWINRAITFARTGSVQEVPLQAEPDVASFEVPRACAGGAG